MSFEVKFRFARLQCAAYQIANDSTVKKGLLSVALMPKDIGSCHLIQMGKDLGSVRKALLIRRLIFLLLCKM